MDFPRSSWASPSSSGVSAAALAAPLSCRLARRALLAKGRENGNVHGRRQRKSSLRFLAALPSALPSRDCDEPPIVDASFSLLDTIRVDEKAKEGENDGRKTITNQSSLFAVAAAALVAASSSLSPFFPPPASASAGGDALITFNKRADAAADAVAGALLGALPKGRSSSLSSSTSSSSSSSSPLAAAAAREEAAEKEAAAAAALLKEVRDVVALNYLDTRNGSSNDDKNGNFDLAAWDAAVEAELTGGDKSGGGAFFFGSGAKDKPREQKLRDVPAARRAARRLLAFQLSDPYSAS